MNLRERIFFMCAERAHPGFRREVCAPAPEARSAPEKEKLLFGAFADLFRQAYASVPYYREKYKRAGLSPESLKRPEDIRYVPCLEKKDILSDEFKTEQAKTAAALASGGTDSRRVVTVMDSACVRKRYQLLLEKLYQTGWKIGVPSAALYPRAYGLWKNVFSDLKTVKLKKILFDFLQAYIIYGFFHNRKNIYYGPELFQGRSAADYAAQLSRKRPYLLVARPDSGGYLIKKAAGEGIAFPGIPVFVAVGTLLAEAAKSNLEQKTGGRIYNLYASTELGYVGMSCGYSGTAVHIDERNYFVEIDKASHNEIIVTDFNNYLMPMLRYRTADTGEWIEHDCACGSKNRLLRVNGRKGRFIAGAAGKRFSEREAAEFFEKINGILLYQLQCGPDDRVMIKVKTTAAKAKTCLKIKDEFCSVFGIPAEKILVTDTAPLFQTRSGKLPIIVPSGITPD